MSQPDGAAAAALGATAAARATRLALEAHLDDAPELAALLPPGYLDAAERFVALLLAANERLNLTRVVAPADVARLHLLDALAALPLLDACGASSVADLGSGGGVPAIPLAIARPTLRWTLVDSVGKKADALRGFIDALKLTGVNVLAERAETLGHDARHRERYGAVTARALAPLPVLAELALPFLSRGGQLIAWKGALGDGDDEVRRGQLAASRLGGGGIRIVASGLPALGGHRFVVVPKVAPTPRRFPRRPGEPGRRPLA